MTEGYQHFPKVTILVIHSVKVMNPGNGRQVTLDEESKLFLLFLKVLFVVPACPSGHITCGLPGARTLF